MDPAGNNLFSTFKNRFLTKGSPKLRWLSEGDQTVMTWAAKVFTREDLPEPFMEFFDALPARDKKPFPYMILMPTYKGYWKPENRRMVCSIRKNIYILEETGKGVLTLCYPAKDIHYIEFGAMLLQTWLTICGNTRQHGLQTTTLKCNAVTEVYLTPIITQARPAPAKSGRSRLEKEKNKFNGLVSSNFKFMNFAKRSLRAGDTVSQMVLQPRIHTEILKLFGRSLYLIKSPAHLCFLTNAELIIIRDDDSRIWQRKQPYGGIWTYIPLKKIVSLSLEPNDKELLELTVNLPKDQQIKLLFHPDKQPELENLLERCKKFKQ
ncbi:MAG: hypothetical protein JXA13_05730 [Anaerolineales bacterium]|nr:hypothetical protein [Anaerolineales bacterium]